MLRLREKLLMLRLREKLLMLRLREKLLMLRLRDSLQIPYSTQIQLSNIIHVTRVLKYLIGFPFFY